MGIPNTNGQQVGCPQIVFEHDGTSPITLHFTDAADGNSASLSGAPVFALARVLPKFDAISACGTPLGSNTYNMQFTFAQEVNWNFSNVSCTVLLQGGVTASNTITGQTIYSAQAFPFQNTFTLQITIDPLFDKNVVATLQFTDISGVLGTLTFDLAPFILVTGRTLYAGNCGLPVLAQFNFICQGLPADNLVLQIDPSGTALSHVTNAGCTSTLSFTIGPVGCAGGYAYFNYSQIAGATSVPLLWSDGAITLPPSSFNLSLSHAQARVACCVNRLHPRPHGSVEAEAQKRNSVVGDEIGPKTSLSGPMQM